MVSNKLLLHDLRHRKKAMFADVESVDSIG